MRIISGTHKGRRIVAPKKLPVRPTTDRAKEGLFNILQHRMDFSTLRVLDLFSGTGNISYEFASRGVPQITAVDENRACVHFIQKTAEQLAFPIQTVNSEVMRYMDRKLASIDLIFADPPYDWTLEQYTELLDKINTHRLPENEIQVILEHSEQLGLEAYPQFDFKRNYGSSVFSFFEI